VKFLFGFLIASSLQTIWALDLVCPPILAHPIATFKAETFTDGKKSDDWHFLKWWESRGGILVRNSLPGENKRIFIKKPEYKDVVIRFDFQFLGAEEIRLVTGGGGSYNFGVHIRQNRFRVRTADDKNIPHFPTILGECTFRFKEGKWYRMQVELFNDHILVRLDAKHFVVGKHPTLNRKREYFAFQVDKSSAAFDNVGIWHAKEKKDWRATITTLIQKQSNRPWVRRSPDKELKDLKMITIDRTYRSDAEYRAVVSRHEQLKALAKKKYPAAYRTSKEAQKSVANSRLKLRENNPDYRQSVNAINKAKRMEVKYLEENMEQLKELSKSQYPAALERARIQQTMKDSSFRILVSHREKLQRDLYKAYPQLNFSDEDVTEDRRKTHANLRASDPAFVDLQHEIAQAWRARSDYLLKVEPRLQVLSDLIKQNRSKDK
jgi:hypothetical protein